MSGAEVAQVCLGVATVISAIAGLVVALRGQTIAAKTHDVVNGQAQLLQRAARASGRRAGVRATKAAQASRGRPPSG